MRAELDPAKQPTYKACDQTPLASDKVRFVVQKSDTGFVVTDIQAAK